MIIRLVFENWGRFRGRHVIEPGRGVFAIVAEFANNPGRSNWAGKSLTLEAIRFALTGWHRFRTEDEWITKGESAGGVSVAIGDPSDPFLIARGRKRGESTQLSITYQGKKAHQADAQKLIYEWLGLSENDLRMTCDFRQKELHRFVTMRPGDRQAVVDEWVDLEPVQAAIVRVRGQLGELSTRAEELAQRAKAFDEQISDHLDRWRSEGDVQNVADLEYVANRLGEAAQAAKHEAEAMKGKIERAAELRRDREKALEYEQVAKELETPLPAAPSEKEEAIAREEFAALSALRRSVAEELSKHRKLVSAGFDGACPVLPGFECPAKDEINARRSEAKKAIAEAETALKEASSKEQQASRRAQDLLQMRAIADRAQGQRQALETRVAELEPAAKRAKSQEVIEIDPDVVRRATEAEAKHAAARRDLETVKSLWQKIGQARNEISELQGEVRIRREAAVLLAKARRRIAERAVTAIELGANERLERIGIELRVRMRWDRETKGPATACDACGAPFSKSRAVKQCVRCGAARGPKLEEKLEVELSDRSGAADDMAGIALALSASAWLRARRGARWAVCCLDEPFGALDQAHREAVGAHVATLLRHDFVQAFVVAHNKDVLDALPDRIEIIADREGSRFRE